MPDITYRVDCFQCGDANVTGQTKDAAEMWLAIHEDLMGHVGVVEVEYQELG